MVQTILNEAPLKRLGKNTDGSIRSPLQVMTGIIPTRKILELEPLPDGVTTKNITEARAIQLLSIINLQESLDNIHRKVGERLTKNRKRDIKHHNQKTNIIYPNFNIGDLVLIRCASEKGHKLKFKWKGPRRVMGSIHEMVYLIQDLITQKQEQVHATRMVIYRADWVGKPVSTELLEDAKHTTTKFETIDEFMAMGEEKGEIWIQIKWTGLPDEIDFTWQKLSILADDVPEMLEEYLLKLGPGHALAQRALKLHPFDKSKDKSGAV